MTPLQFAQEQCSNFNHDGSCAGIGIKNDGRLYSFGKKPKCVLGKPGVRCRFFEECVAPMGFEDLKKRAERDEAIKLYRVSSNAPKLAHQTKRLCPLCKSRELEPHKHLCYVCAEERRLQSTRDAVRRHRGV